MSRKQRKARDWPLVTICTPTQNRRMFIPALISCFESQTYPMDRVEWLIVDDGDDPIEDLVGSIPEVNYHHLQEKMTLGAKRNYMNGRASGDILVYMDDDDFYPPDRILHAVQALSSRPEILIAGSSIMHIYFKRLAKIYRFGPYGPNHATAATFAFKRKLLEQTQFDEAASVSEERAFLKGYTIPMVQLDTRKTILAFAHRHNTYEKEKLLINPDPRTIRETKFPLKNFIKNDISRTFYLDS